MCLDWRLLLLFFVMVERSDCTAHMSNVSAALGSSSNEDNNDNSGRNYVRDFPARKKSKKSRKSDDVQVGCKELRAKRFISDGFCTSLRPINEVVCAGFCLPIKEKMLPWWAEFTKYWARPKLREWRCVEAVVKLKKVQLMCENGEIRTYKIKIVKSCKCKSYKKEHNITGTKNKGKHVTGRRGKRNKKNKLTKEERRQRRKERKRLRRKNRMERKRRKMTQENEQQQQIHLNSKDSVLNNSDSKKV